MRPYTPSISTSGHRAGTTSHQEIIDKFVMDNNPHTQELGPYWAVACLQRLKIILQNWAFDDRNQIFIRLILSMNRVISGPRELKVIKDDIITLSKLREKEQSFRPGEGESRLVIMLCKKQHSFLRGAKLLSPFFKWRMDSTLFKIQLDFVSGERTSFAQFFDMLQCIFNVKIWLELPFGADDHREGEHQMDILGALVVWA
jgi:hypothetical protein